MTISQIDKNKRIDAILLQNEKLHKCINTAIASLLWVDDYEGEFCEVERELTIAVNKLQEILF